MKVVAFWPKTGHDVDLESKTCWSETNNGKVRLTPYSTAKVSAYADKNKKLSLDPGITEAFAKSTDPKELEYYWTEWRRVTGREMRDMYAQFIKLANEAAR